MGSRINPSWMKNKEEEIKKNTFTSATTSYNPAAQWLISYLDYRDTPVKVINLGAGVKKIMIAEKVCPTCNGKGFVE